MSQPNSPFPHPTTWPVMQLRDLCLKIGSGATPSGGDSSYLNQRKTWAFVRSQNVFDRHFDTDGLSFIDDDQAARLKGVELRPDDVLLNITGDGITFGRACRVAAQILPAVVNQHVAIVRPDQTKLRSGFLLAYLTHPFVKPYIAGFNTGGSRRAVTKAHIESFEIPTPDVICQDAISVVLDTIDDKIELNRRISQTLEAIAQAIFKSWFVDFEPVRAKANGEDAADIEALLGLDEATQSLFPSQLTARGPNGWQPVTLKQLTNKIGSGATPRGGREVYIEEGIALIRSQNVYDSQFIWDGLARITDDAARQLANVEVQAGDVLLNITGASILRTCVVPPDVLPARVNQHVAIIRAKPGVPPHFLHLHLLQADTKAYLLGLNAGASREAVTKAHIESVPLLYPGAELLAAFGTKVAPLFAQARVCAAEARALTGLRDALLPKLLSGELSTAAIVA